LLHVGLYINILPAGRLEVENSF